jgi:hypothetical protein
MKLIMNYKDENIGNHIFEISPYGSMFEGKEIEGIRFTLKDGRKHIWTHTIEDWIDPLQEQPVDPSRRVKDNYRIFHFNKVIILFPKRPWVLDGKRLSYDEWVHKNVPV